MVFFTFSRQSQNETIKKVVLVSLHVRRTDYLYWLAENVKGQIVSTNFFKTAMDTFRQNYSTSDTKVNNLKDIFIFLQLGFNGADTLESSSLLIYSKSVERICTQRWHDAALIKLMRL
jgi:hypothetical protein